MCICMCVLHMYILHSLRESWGLFGGIYIYMHIYVYVHTCIFIYRSRYETFEACFVGCTYMFMCMCVYIHIYILHSL